MKLIINMITDKLKNFYVKHAPFKKMEEISMKCIYKLLFTLFA